MKKFTGNFLHGEHGIFQVLRKIGLSVVAVLLAVVAFSQAQDTYHVWADDVEDCYREDNTYKVQISFRDFVKIDSFILKLKYDHTVYDADLLSFKVLRTDEISSAMVYESTSGTLEFMWDVNNEPGSDSFKTIEPNNEKTPVMEICFNINNYRHNYDAVPAPPTSFYTALTWQSGSEFWNDEGQVTDILTEDLAGHGKIDVDQMWDQIVVDVTPALCDTDIVVATVVTPENVAGMEYSWNGTTFTDNPSTNVDAPATDVTVLVRKGDCISYQERFDVETTKMVSFTVSGTDVLCPGGQADVEIDANYGAVPYTYYIIPDADFPGALSGSLTGYSSSIGVSQKDTGTYYVAVQDANDCVDLTDSGSWKMITVEDNNDPWDVTISTIDPNCNGADNGEISISISGATAPYYVSFEGGTEIETSNKNWDELVDGTYTIDIRDSEGCFYTTSVTLTEPASMKFEVGHTDASCEADIGEIWIEPGTITGGSESYGKWWYSTVPDFSSYTEIASVADTAENIPGGVYYIRIFDSNGCFADYMNDQGDNSVKVLTLEFDVNYDPIACYNGSTTATIDLVSGDGSHDLWYKLNDGTPQKSNSFDISVETGSCDTFTFTAIDSTINCEYVEVLPICQPDSLWVKEIKELTLPPTCHDNNDGNIQVRGYGGTPFVDEGGTQYYLYQFDGRAWEASEDVNNTFAAGMGPLGDGVHEIKIQDANGCIASITVTLELTPNLIGDEEATVVCYGDVVTMDIDTISWIKEPAHLNQGKREPRFYYSATTSVATEIVAEGNRFYPSTVVDPLVPTELGAGTYYVVGKDEWGCYSNVAEYDVYQPEELMITVTPTDAECAGEFGGTITIEAFNSMLNVDDSSSYSSPRYQYVIFEATTGTTKEDAHWDILEDPTWYDTQVDWSDFENDDPANDSVMVADAMKGVYFVAVRDYCGAHGRPELIKMDTVVIDGRDAIALDTDGVTIENIDCHTWDPIEEEFVYEEVGAITIDPDYVSGGYPPYEFTLSGQESDGPNTTGIFTGLDTGSYVVTISDSLNCPVYEYSFDITMPYGLKLELDHVNPSCYGKHDGLLVYRLSGGNVTYVSSTGLYTGYQEATNNVGEFEDVNDIPEERWFDVNVEDVVHGNQSVFDRAVEAGEYEVWIRDEKGCISGPYYRTVVEPAELGYVADLDDPSCSTDDTQGVSNDGAITIWPTGGWESTDDDFMYTVTLKIGTTTTTSPLIDSGGFYKFENLVAGDYTVTVTEFNDNIASDGYSKPYNQYIDYLEKWHEYDDYVPFQNPDVTDCFATGVETLDDSPIEYDTITWADLLCHDPIDSGVPHTATGAITISGVTGGDGDYKYMVQGPKDYLYNDVWYDPDNYDLPKDEWTWDDLVNGHYTVFVRDGNGCTIFRESGELENADSLQLVTELVENPLCHDGNGIVAMHASGGTGAGTYKFAIIDVSDTEFPTSDEEAVANLDWSPEMVDSDTFEVPWGIYIGFVMDANGCVQGFATDEEGTPILIHRVEIDNPTAVEADGLSVTDVNCYAGTDGIITVDAISGGNGGDYTAVVTGTTWEGKALVNSTGGAWSYGDLEGSDEDLDGLPASTPWTREQVSADLDILTDDDYYSIVFYDSEGCVSSVYKVIVYQPMEFIVALDVQQDAFICPDDLAGVFEVIVLQGGVPFSGNQDEFLYRWEIYTDSTEAEGLTGKVEETEYAFTSTFQGQAGVWYKVFAKDANDCVTSAIRYVEAPEKIVYNVNDVSCHEDAETGAYAQITVTSSNPGRTHEVKWVQVTGVGQSDIIAQSSWMPFGTDTLINALSYGDVDQDGGHYIFYVRDNLGCMAKDTFITFVPVQHPLTMTVATVSEGECTNEVMITPAGGIEPYTVTINGTEVDYTVAQTVSDGDVILVTDAHLRCEATETAVVAGNPVANEETITTLIGEDVAYSNVEAGLTDTMLNAAGSPYVFNYTVGGCPRTLTVTVVEVAQVLTIAEVQGTGDDSPYAGETAAVTGTVTGIIPGEGYFMQDASAVRSGIRVADATTTVNVGSAVTVTGVISENNGVTTLTATSAEPATPINVTPLEVAGPSAVASEDYESVLVELAGVRTAAGAAAGEWSVFTEDTNTATVSDNLLALGITLTVDAFYDLAGIVNGAADAFKVELTEILTTDGPKGLDIEFSVYPNPFNDKIYIDNAQELTRLVISNIAGQRVIDIEYPEREVRTPNLVSGVYVVTMFTESGIAKTERIVKR